MAEAAGVILFAAGFAPSAQATWHELLSSLILGAIMGVLFVGVEHTPGCARCCRSWDPS